MQDLTCDDCTQMNNGNSSNEKTIDPCAVSLAANGIALTGAEHLSNEQHSYNNKNGYSGSLLSGIKLEDSQDSSTLVRDSFKCENPKVLKPETLVSSWPQTDSVFSRVESGSELATATTRVQQDHHNQHHINPHCQTSHTAHASHHPYHHHSLASHPHQHHQLLLKGSDDPLISHGADSVINDEDHSVELENLFTAATNGQQQQQQHQLEQRQNQQYQLKQHQQNIKQHHHHQPQQSRVTTTASGLIHKRPQNGCSSLTKQQLKMKAGLMNAAQQQQQQTQHQSEVQKTKKTSYNMPGNSGTNPANKTIPPKPIKSKKKSINSNSNIATGSGAVKLRFHHQALPPEYLSHYEATQRQLRQNVSAMCSSSRTSAKEATGTTSSTVKVAQTAKLPPPKSSHENVRSWLQKIAEIQRTAQQQQQQQQHQPFKQQIVSKTTIGEYTNQRIPVKALQHNSDPDPDLDADANADANNNHKSPRMSDSYSPLLQVNISPVTYERTSYKTVPHSAAATATSATSRMTNYADLPYMGEITLNNSKPRRGRKPKKADICHLIYKNYGTIFPDSSKNVPVVPQTEFATKKQVTITSNHEEPLNLCLRDYQSLDLYSVSSGEANCEEVAGLIDEVSDSGDTNSNCTTPGDAMTDSMLATNMKTAMPGLEEIDEYKSLKKELDTKLNKDETTNMLLHPVRAYYQKLLESGMLLKQSENGSTSTITVDFAGLPIETIEKDNQIALKIPIPSGFFVSSKSDNKPMTSSTPLDYPEPLSTPSSIKSEQSFTTTTTSSYVNSSYCNGITTLAPNATPQKRKRSAIFIPPMPAENASNPANEVSICKFKFTGGVKPTLQEKKMLSVDSDGNYRYYSGTGDKSMRGYEFFPRESLQQSGFLPGVGGAGAFLNATGEKISPDIPPPSADLNNELLQIPDSPTGPLLMDGAPTVTTTGTITVTAHNKTSQSPLASLALSNLELSQTRNQTATAHAHATVTPTSSYESSLISVQSNGASPFHRKKKSSQSSFRRSSQREKLERTFKEKGFLIQTQQLESAEGATYCKFRQLKKFTRYLFRNWKDYLPDGQVDEAGQHAAIESLLSSHGFHTWDTDMDHNAQFEAGAEVLSTDELPGVERA